MRICMLTTSFPREQNDFAGNFVWELSRALVRAGDSVTVVAPHSAGAETDSQWEGVTVNRFRYWLPIRAERVAYGSGVMSNLRHSALAWAELPFFFVSYFFAARRAARGAAVVHAHWIFSGLVGWLVAWRRRIPLVVTVHGSDAHLVRRFGLMRLIARFALHRARMIITVSDQLRQDVLALGIAPDRVHTIHNGAANFEALLALPAATGQSERALWVGRFTEEKDPLTALKAFFAAAAGLPALRLTMVGAGPLREQCEQWCDRSGLTARVEFRNPVPPTDMPEIFSHHDVLLVSSRREGLPLVVVEALVAGRPVIATRAGGIPEIVANLRSGIVVEISDADALGAALRQAFAGPNRIVAMASQGKASAAGFSWATVAAKTQRLYSSLG